MLHSWSKKQWREYKARARGQHNKQQPLEVLPQWRTPPPTHKQICFDHQPSSCNHHNYPSKSVATLYSTMPAHLHNPLPLYYITCCITCYITYYITCCTTCRKAAPQWHYINLSKLKLSPLPSSSSSSSSMLMSLSPSELTTYITHCLKAYLRFS